MQAGLKRRGDLTLWGDETAIAGRHASRRTTPGGQARYSDLTIELMLTRRLIFLVTPVSPVTPCQAKDGEKRAKLLQAPQLQLKDITRQIANGSETGARTQGLRPSDAR
jgi:hypothetical protein